MLICPLSANTMAKIVNGICDNLLVYTIDSIKIIRHVLLEHGILNQRIKS